MKLYCWDTKQKCLNDTKYESSEQCTELYQYYSTQYNSYFYTVNQEIIINNYIKQTKEMCFIGLNC